MDRSLIKDAVDLYDLMGLLKMGCPDDEYDPEIDRIFARVYDGISEEELAAIIYDVFREMFGGLPINKERCSQMAHEIISCDS